jgi:predicted nucleic acid-binding protein
MTRIFADTSYWIAILNPRDPLHKKAVALSQVHSGDQIVTTEMILTEFLNSFSNQGPFLRRAAGTFVEGLRQNPKVVIFSQTSEQFEKALGRYLAMADKSWSLTDCASFLLMEAENIRAALTHDRHFVQAGFEAHLR